ncbi:hypothetical protein CFA78_01545 [Salmonella enterica subsp. enterica serovar Heidelberg]|nr:4Fe-4S binding protein [Salmonella enterica]OZI04658.1 hypothetical protein CFA78_01545 [Salmonella enterica subsp. enterica serovar Heidelberg]
MTTQYGFFIDSSRCTGCKTCELACKDYKDLTPDVSFRRIYEYAGGDWQEDNGVWHQNVFAYQGLQRFDPGCQLPPHL